MTPPPQFRIKLEAGNAPMGVRRFIELVNDEFFTDMLLYRVIPGFLVQFGVASNPETQAKWNAATIKDEPNRVPFRRGTLSFAGAGTDSRSCHLFVALEPNGLQLGNAPHEATLGHVENPEVFETVASNFEASGYPDLGELQAKLVEGGNDVAAEYPKLDRILSAEIVE